MIVPSSEQATEPETITCRLGGREFDYQLTCKVQDWNHPAGWTVRRRLARLASANVGRFSAATVMLELFDIGDHRLAQQLLERFERFYRLSLPGWVELTGGGRVVSQLHYDNTVVVYPAWTISLAELLARDGPMDQVAAEQLLAQLARALFAAHNLGLAHGDICAENVVGRATQTGQMSWQLTLGLPNPAKAASPLIDVVRVQELLLRVLGVPSADAAPSRWRSVLTAPAPPVSRLLFGFRPLPLVGPIRAEVIATQAGQQVCLHWPAVEGEVRFYDVSRSNGLLEGSIHPVAVLDRLGEPLVVTRDQSWTAPLTARAVLAVSVVDGVAVIGERVYLGSYPDVCNLSVSVSRGQAHATWSWPADCRVAVLTARSDRFALTPDDASLQRTITRQEYETAGGCRWLLPDTQTAEVFVVVFATAHPQAGHACGAAGARVRVLTHQPIVRYSVRPRSASSTVHSLWQRLFGRKECRDERLTRLELRLQADELLTLPELLLVADLGRPPESSTAGRVVLRLAAGQRLEPAKVLTIPFTLDLSESLWLRLFTDSASASKLRLESQPNPSGIALDRSKPSWRV